MGATERGQLPLDLSVQSCAVCAGIDRSRVGGQRGVSKKVPATGGHAIRFAVWLHNSWSRKIAPATRSGRTENPSESGYGLNLPILSE
jgi:hypothetical protein